MVYLLLINWQHKGGPRVWSQAGSCVEAQAGDTALGQGRGTASPCPRDGRKRSPLMGEPPGINTAANEQTEPEELKENEEGTGGQAWGRAAFSRIPHPCPGLRSLCLGPKARTSVAHRLGEGAHINLPAPGLTAKRLGRSSDRATFKSPLTSGWAKAPSF